MKVEGSGGTRSQLKHELEMYKILGQTPGFPRCEGFTVDKKRSLNFLLITRLGPSLQDVLMNAPGKKLSLRIVSIIGLRCIERLRSLHEQGLIHRDVKPQNFLLGPTGRVGSSSVYCVDFGLMKRYRKSGRHIAYAEHKQGLTGTPRFASVWQHEMKEASRRDDLQGLMYMLAYLHKGSLPWQKIRKYPNTPSGKRQRSDAILSIKRQWSDERLFSSMPRFAEMAAHVRSLHFDERPNYTFLLDQLKKTYRECKPMS